MKLQVSQGLGRQPHVGARAPWGVLSARHQYKATIFYIMTYNSEKNHVIQSISAGLSLLPRTSHLHLTPRDNGI